MPRLPLLRDRRRDLSLTQATVVCAAGISIPTLRNLERGKGSIGSLSRPLPYLQLRWFWFHDANAGSELARRRRMRGLSQRAMAHRVGCSRPTIIALKRDLTGRVETRNRQRNTRPWCGSTLTMIPKNQTATEPPRTFKRRPEAETIEIADELSAHRLGKLRTLQSTENCAGTRISTISCDISFG